MNQTIRALAKALGVEPTPEGKIVMPTRALLAYRDDPEPRIDKTTGAGLLARSAALVESTIAKESVFLAAGATRYSGVKGNPALGFVSTTAVADTPSEGEGEDSTEPGVSMKATDMKRRIALAVVTDRLQVLASEENLNNVIAELGASIGRLFTELGTAALIAEDGFAFDADNIAIDAATVSAAEAALVNNYALSSRTIVVAAPDVAGKMQGADKLWKDGMRNGSVRGYPAHAVKAAAGTFFIGDAREIVIVDSGFMEIDVDENYGFAEGLTAYRATIVADVKVRRTSAFARVTNAK